MSQLQVTGEAKIRDIQGPVVANSGVITALDGAASQYVRGDGTLADFPTSTGGGSSVSYYLNGSVNQGTFAGSTYYEMSKTPIIGAGTDFPVSTNGLVAQFITDANDPDLLEVPGGNFNLEFYFSVSNNTGNPTVYAELYKYDGTTFTLLGSSQAVPESINQGTTIAPYYFAIPVGTAALALTDRIAIRIYANVDGRTVTLHTENSHLCQVVTTFSKGMVSLNNLTDQSQFITTGTSGTDFNIVSTGDTHTFNLPVASATNTGKLSSTDWSTFNAKQAALSFTAPLVNTSNTISIPAATSLVDGYLDNLDWVNFNTAYNNMIVSAAVTGTTTKTLTLTQQDAGTITASWTDDNTDAVTSVFGRTGAVVAASGDYTTTQVTEGTNLYFTNLRAQNAITLTTTGTSGAATYSGGTLNIPQYQGVLTNPVTGTGTTNTLPKFTGTSAIGNSNITDTGSLITLGSNSYVNGNLAVGLTPASTWGRSAFEIGVAGASITREVRDLVLLSNSIWTSTGLVYAATAGAGRFDVGVSSFRWYTAPSGTAGNAISFTQAMTLDANGALGIGTTSLTGLNLRVSKNITGQFINSGGSFGVGILSDGQIQSDEVGGAAYYRATINTQAATFTAGSVSGYAVEQGTIGASSVISNQYGFVVGTTLIGATNNFGFASFIPSGTNRWNLYMAGTAANYLAGQLLIGTTSVLADYPLNAQGTANGNLLFRFANTSNGTSARMGLILATDSGTLGSIDAFGTAYNIGSTDDIANGIRLLSSGAGGLSLRASNASGTIRFYNGSTESARFGTNGALGIAATNLGSVSLFISKTMSGSIDSFHVNVNGVIQSDVTNSATYFRSGVSTAAGAFTLANLYHYTTSQGTIGAGSAVTNQYGFFVNSNLTGATNDFGFYGNLAAATNVWNLYMNGTANNYMAGSLGIGATGLNGYNLRVSRNISGSVDSYGIMSDGQIQSDVTTSTDYFRTNASTQATAFTLFSLNHYNAGQGTFGASSAVTNQSGFIVAANMIGATNNFGFRGLIPSGTNRWNIYMDGTANNYMAGSLGIGSTSLTQFNFRVSKTITGNITSYAQINDGIIQSDVTTGVYYRSTAATAAATFTTDVQHFNASQGTFGVGSIVTNQYGYLAANTLIGATNNYGFFGSIPSGTNRWNLYMAGTADNYLAGNLGVGTLPITSKISIGAAVLNNSTVSIINATSDNTTYRASIQLVRGGSSGLLGWAFTTNSVTSGEGTERIRIKPTGQMRFVPLAADPTGAEAGDVYYNSTISALKLYDGTVWRTITVI